MSKLNSTTWAVVLALTAAIGNAFYAYGQKKAIPHDNPFIFGVLSLFIGSVLLGLVAVFFGTKDIGNYFVTNLTPLFISGFGFVLLNIGLYFLYQNFGASYYSLYAVLSIVTTSILLAILVLGEKMNIYYWFSFGFAGLTVLFFMKAQSVEY